MTSAWTSRLGIAVTASALSSACASTSTEIRSQDRPEDVWLSRIGNGSAQNERVCARGGRDRVAAALCNPRTPAIRGLEDLYAALGLAESRHIAATTHSLGLSVRSVSALNPRAFVFDDRSDPPPTANRIVAAGFTRGEQFVELVGLDPKTYEYNFYLLHFEQDCNRSRCTPEDLLTERVERDWTTWTVYTDEDLVDTPLDCLSCHQPYGKGTHKLLLMRQLIDPWMHWGDFRGGTERFVCPEPPADGSEGQVVVTADGLDALVSLEGTTGRYAGIPVSDLHAAKSGSLFVELLNDAGQVVTLAPIAQTPSEQPYLQTREVVCERFHTGTSKTWDADRRAFLARGFPMPYYAPDVTDPARRAEVLADRPGFLRRHEGDDAFELTFTFMGRDVATDVGLVPRASDSAPDIVRALCVRCHAGNTEPQLRRSRFDATKLDAVDPATFREVRRRLTLSASSPELMPPRRTGELPSWATARVLDYLRERCSPRGACL